MTQNPALSIPNETPAQPTKRTVHEHTCATAVECFDGAVQKNMAKQRLPINAAVRLALPWGESKLLRQIKDPAEVEKFKAFLDGKRAEHPQQTTGVRPRGPKLISADEADGQLRAAANPYAIAERLLREKSRWEPADVQKIEDVILSELGTAKRQEFYRKGFVLNPDILAQAETEAKAMFERLKRAGQRDGNPRQRGARAPQRGGNRSGDRGPSFAGGGNVTRKDESPKVTGSATPLEQQVSTLKSEIDRKLKLVLLAQKSETLNEDEKAGEVACLSADVAQLRAQLSEVRAKITAEQQKRADAKKAERIARSQKSAAASKAIPTFTAKAKVAEAAPAAKSGKRK